MNQNEVEKKIAKMEKTIDNLYYHCFGNTENGYYCAIHNKKNELLGYVTSNRENEKRLNGEPFELHNRKTVIQKDGYFELVDE